MPVRVVAVVLAAGLLLTGCNGSREMDELAFVAALGLDAGQGSALEVTFAIANPPGGGGGGPGGKGGGGAGGGESVLVITVEAPDIGTALNLVDAAVARHLSLEQMKAVFISEELARQGVRPLLNALRRYFQFRDTAFVFVNRGRTSDLLQKNKPAFVTSLAKQIELVMANARLGGDLPYIQVKSFVNAMESQGHAPIAAVAALNEAVEKKQAPAEANQGQVEVSYLAGQVPRQDGNPFELMGTAVFRDDKLVGFLDGLATRALLIVRGEFGLADFTLPDPRASGRALAVAVRQRQKPAVQVERSPEGFHVRERIALEYDLEGVQSTENYECPAASGEIDALVAGFVEQQATGVIQLAQRRFQSDILGFSLYAAHTAATWDEWQALDWPAHFPGATVDLTVTATMRRPGMLFKTGGGTGGENRCFS